MDDGGKPSAILTPSSIVHRPLSKVYRNSIMELLINAVTATAQLERCHYLKTVQSEDPDGTRASFIVEGDFVARQGTYERHERRTYGDDAQAGPYVEILRLEGVLYRRFAEGSWEKGRSRNLLLSIISARYPWLASRHLEEKAASQASIPDIPGWGSLDIQLYSFTEMGEVLMSDTTTHYFVGVPKPVDYLVRHKIITISLWIGTEDRYLHKLTEVSDSIVGPHPDAPPGTISFHWIGTDRSTPEKDKPIRSLVGTTRNVSEMILSRFNDPTISLPKP